jgi:hypothetical protein
MERYLGARLGRRDFLTQSLAVGTLLMLPGLAQAATIRKMEGEVRVNGQLAKMNSQIYGDDIVTTGPNSSVMFVLSGDAFFLRANSRLDLTASDTSAAIISALRLVSGAFGAAFARGGDRRIVAPNVTAGVRGTGVFVEVKADSTYFCTCYGAVDLATDAPSKKRMEEKVLATGGTHQARSIHTVPKKGFRIDAAPLLNHTNADMIALEALVGRPDPFMTR